MPSEIYAQFLVRFSRAQTMPESETCRLLGEVGYTVANLNYRIDVASDSFEYQMTIRTNDRANAGKLTQALNRIESIKEYRISPTGD